MESEDASMDLWWFLIEMTSHNHDISSNGQYQYINYFFLIHTENVFHPLMVEYAFF